MEQSVCPECRARIGGQDHVPERGNVAVNNINQIFHPNLYLIYFIFNNLFNEIYQIVSPINRGQFLVILNENTVVLCSL